MIDPAIIAGGFLIAIASIAWLLGFAMGRLNERDAIAAFLDRQKIGAGSLFAAMVTMKEHRRRKGPSQ